MGHINPGRLIQIKASLPNLPQGGAEMRNHEHLMRFIMFRLALILHLFIGSTLAGTAIIAALVTGNDGWMAITFAAALGFLGGFPVSWLVARRLWRE